MARQFSDGAEFGDGLFWNSIDWHDYAVGSPRTGNYCYKPYYADAYKYFTPASEIYFRTGFNITYAPGGNMFDISYYGTHFLMFNYAAASGAISVYNYATGAWMWGAVSCATLTWHLLEFHLLIDDVNGVFETRVNGISDITFNGDTKVGSTSEVSEWHVNGIGQSYDDIALNDTTGGADNSWCGDEHYELHPANDNGDTNNWMGSDADKVDNYALVDDIPQNGDTDYVYSNTALEQDMYNVTDYTATGKIPTRIWAECRARDANALSGQIKIGYKTSGTVYLCSSGRVLGSNYTRVVGDEATINPADSGAWEDADLDAIQFVAECE